MKRILKVVIGLSTAAILFAGCATANTSKNLNDNGSGKKTIKVGTMGTYEPFSYVDKDGNLTGYDLEVLREAQKRIEGYEFEFVAGPWDSLFVGLEADRFQILANQIGRTKEREEKYLLTDNSYFKAVTQPIVRENDNSIASLKDLKGKKVGATVGDNHTLALEEYNKANGNEINIEYYESDISSVLQDLVTGRIDATVNDPIMAKKKAEVLDLQIKTISDNLIESNAYFVMKNDAEGKELKEQLDQALNAMKEDGTLSKLSVQWFGEDYTHTNANLMP